MPKSTLFICKSCHHSAEKRPADQPAAGQVLLDQIIPLATQNLLSDTVEIQPVDRLWTCGQTCSADFSAPHKPTYLFTNLTAPQMATALFQFAQLYSSSKTGDIPWKQFPEALQTASIAKIPAVE